MATRIGFTPFAHRNFLTKTGHVGDHKRRVWFLTGPGVERREILATFYLIYQAYREDELRSRLWVEWDGERKLIHYKGELE